MTEYLVVAPQSNRRTRDWPLSHYRSLAIMCAEQLHTDIFFVGSAQQRDAANMLVRGLSSETYHNRCGQLNWLETEDLIRGADCVISNNSGVGHLAASLAVPVLSIFGASHSPLEWMHRGTKVSVVARQTACSPCVIDDFRDCPFEVRCLTSIDVGTVFREVCRLLNNPTDDVDRLR